MTVMTVARLLYSVVMTAHDISKKPLTYNQNEPIAPVLWSLQSYMVYVIYDVINKKAIVFTLKTMF